MRKLLLMSFLMALFSGVFAQTQDSPKEIPIGEENAFSYSATSYFTYTAPTNTNVFLKVVAVGGNKYFWHTAVMRKYRLICIPEHSSASI